MNVHFFFFLVNRKIYIKHSKTIYKVATEAKVEAICL